MDDIKQVLKNLIKIIRRPEMKILPGQLSYHLFLSIFPIIALVGFVTSLFKTTSNELTELLSDVFPKVVSDILVPFVSGRGIDFNVIIFMITGFVVASNGPHSIIITSNTLYKINHSDYLRRRIKAIFLTVLLIILVIFSITVLAFGNIIVKFVLELNALQTFSSQLYILFVILKWPAAFIIIFFIVKLLYTMAPDANIPSKHMNNGAIFTTLAWSLVTAFYSYYVSNFTNYDLLYGSLSSIIVLMFWIYLLSYILVLGIAINSNDPELEKCVDNICN